MEENKMPPKEWRLREEIRSLQIALEEERVMREQSMANIGDLSRQLIEERKRLGLAMAEASRPKTVWIVYPDNNESPPDVWATREDAFAAAASTISEHLEDGDELDAEGDEEIVRLWNSSYEPKYVVEERRVLKR